MTAGLMQTNSLEVIEKIIKMKAIPKIVCSCGDVEICDNKSKEQIYSILHEKHFDDCEKLIFGFISQKRAYPSE